MKKTIIITGVSGFIGSHLAEFLKKKYFIIGIDREPNNIKGITFHKQDINDKLPDYTSVYAVIHLAARAGVRESNDKFEEYVKDNIIGTKNILDKCVNNWKPNRVLIASSSSVYGNTDKFNEKNPRSLYAMSKCATEDIADVYRRSGLFNNISCMRFFTVYGPKQRKGLAFREFIDNILLDKPITVYGDGTQLRDFTYIDDLCKSIKTYLERPATYFKLDLGSGNPISLNEVIYKISKITGKNITINYQDWNKYDVFKTCSHVKTIVNPTPIDEGLKKQIEWQRNQLNIKNLGKSLKYLSGDISDNQ